MHKKEKLIEHLSGFTTPHKLTKMDQVLEERTEHVTVVLEDIFQHNNISASIRSAEALGVQNVHVIEQHNPYDININISKGATNWVTINRYNKAGSNNTEQCFENLRSQGYWIVATSPHKTAYKLHELPIDKKLAFVFGTEDVGISDYARENADATVTIPMFGFTESFNISVSVSLCLYDVMTRLRQSSIPWQLTQAQKTDIKLNWLRSSIRGSEFLEKQFLEDNN